MYLDRIYPTIKQLEEFQPAFIRFNKLEMEYFYTQMPPLQMPPLYMLNLPMLLQKKNNYVGSNLKLHTLHQLSTVELYQYLDQLINGAFCQCSSISIRTIAIDEGCGKIKCLFRKQQQMSLAAMPILKFPGILNTDNVELAVSTDRSRCINFISLDDIIGYLHHKPGVKRELRIDFFSSGHLRNKESDSMKQIIPYLYKLAGKLAEVS